VVSATGPHGSDLERGGREGVYSRRCGTYLALEKPEAKHLVEGDACSSHLSRHGSHRKVAKET